VKTLSAPIARTSLTHRRTIAMRAAYAVIVSAVSLTGTLAAGYFFVSLASGSRVSLSELMREDYLWPIAAIATAIALGVVGMLHFIESRTVRSSAHPRTGMNADLSRPSQSQNMTEVVKRMVRNVERLNEVECDLIHKISVGGRVDLQTDRLITEMRICTNRLLAQLQELDVEDTADRPNGDIVRQPVYRA